MTKLSIFIPRFSYKMIETDGTGGSVPNAVSFNGDGRLNFDEVWSTMDNLSIEVIDNKIVSRKFDRSIHSEVMTGIITIDMLPIMEEYLSIDFFHFYEIKSGKYVGWRVELVFNGPAEQAVMFKLIYG